MPKRPLTTARAFGLAVGLAIGTGIAGGALTFTVLPAEARASVSISFFHEELAPFGHWYQHPRWGYVWYPFVESRDWRPYTRGHWVWTDEHGWYWVSDESEERWGWATFHYGRWVLDDDYGWVWVPGTDWGPAWVAWRHSDDYVGWAPLHPEDRWEPGGGYAGVTYFYESRRYAPVWCFVAPLHMTRPRVYTHFAAPSRNVLIINRTRNITNYTFVNQRVVNRGVEVRFIERAQRRPIEPVRINVVGSPREARFTGFQGGGGGRAAGGATVVSVFRPTLTGPVNIAPPPTLSQSPRRAPPAPSGFRVTTPPAVPNVGTPGPGGGGAGARQGFNPNMQVPSNPGVQQQPFNRTTVPAPRPGIGEGNRPGPGAGSGGGGGGGAGSVGGRYRQPGDRPPEQPPRTFGSPGGPGPGGGAGASGGPTGPQGPGVRMGQPPQGGSGPSGASQRSGSPPQGQGPGPQGQKGQQQQHQPPRKPPPGQLQDPKLQGNSPGN